MTKDGTLRHPSYLGLRDNKKPEAVIVETEAPVEQVAEIGATPSSSVKISNPDRVIDPGANITKGQLAEHFAAVASIMLPWAGSRPISLVRCLQGRAKKCFFQKHDGGTFGAQVHHVGITEKDGHVEPYLFIDDADGLLTCVQIDTIEFHGWGARHFRDILKRARDVSDGDGREGVHVIAPLTPRAEWPEVKDFARRLALAVAQSDPENFMAALPKIQRKGRIFVDYLRNQRGATAVMPYAVRARPGSPVAVPVSWKEMETIDSPAHWHVGDAKELVRRA
jgi:bifunctional non-homologous end joining protein LigD